MAAQGEGKNTEDAMIQWHMGDMRIPNLVEREVTGFAHRFLLLNATPEACQAITWLQPHCVTAAGKIRMSVHALVVETLSCRIIVDPCFGNDKRRELVRMHMRHGAFLTNMAAAGFAASSFQSVLCTHLHVDHVGWNTRWVDGKWKPTFPHARSLMARQEFEYWNAHRSAQQYGDYMADSVPPVREAGLVNLVASDHQVCDEVWLEPTPGHVSVRIASQGHSALMTGDFMHHPCQMVRPHWCSTADYDSHAAEETRRWTLAQLATEETLVIGTHFAGPSAGRVKRDGAVWWLDTAR
jgi:glyoxylase-like metal-dependent hydrolase (beta-lactamase superfamily II)